MTRYLILAQTKESAAALQEAVKILGTHIMRKENGEGHDPHTVVLAGSRDPLVLFQGAVPVMSEMLGKDTGLNLEPLVVLVDCIRLSALDPLAETGWSPAIAMLILAFPEVRWVFGCILDDLVSTAKEEKKDGTAPLPSPWTRPRLDLLKLYHGLDGLLHPEWDPLFDGTGLREFVRATAEARVTARNEPSLIMPHRHHLSVSMDEESSYCNFNAMAAYRSGYRCFAIRREELSVYVLGRVNDGGANTPQGDVPEGKSLREQLFMARNADPLRLALEDLHLNFPDRQKNRLGEGTSLSDLKLRTQLFPRLGKPTKGEDPGPVRVFVTTGRHKTDADSKWLSNDDYRNFLEHSGRSGRMVRKPVSGLFKLWREAKLEKAAGFEWPTPVDGDGYGAALLKEGHSARGRLLEIATCLLHRAIGLDVKSTSQAVVGAVLATDAMELLGGKTPTTSLEALALKHQFEVQAEVHFYGVGAKLDVLPRIKDIQKEIDALSENFDSDDDSSKSVSKMNAEASILGDLVRIFREHNQFDEEQIVQCQARKVHFDLFLKEHTGLVIRPILWPLMRYFTFLLSSIPNFLAGALACLLALGLAFSLTETGNVNDDKGQGTILLKSSSNDQLIRELKSRLGSPQPDSRSTLRKFNLGMQDAVSSFVSVGQPFSETMDPEDHDPRWLFYFLACLSMILGLLHMGIFISHLYSLMARR